MKKTILMAVLLASGGVFADSYLYWMIDTSSANNYNYSYARIKDVSSGTENYLTIYDGSFEEPYNDGQGGVSGAGKTYIDLAANANDGFYAALGSISPSSASIIVELYNDSGTWLAQNMSSSGEIAGYIYAGGISAPPAVPWTAGSFAVPEPTSGLLMLLGMAGLALRRRKNV